MTLNGRRGGWGKTVGFNADGAGPSGWTALFAGGNAGPLAVLTGGVLMHALSLRVVATVLPSAVAEIGGLRLFAWTVTLAFLGAIWGAALAARLAASRGLRGAYRISLLVFAGGSATCATAPDIGLFLAGRLLQGLGGGLLMALAYTAIRRLFPTALHTRAITMVSGVWSVGALCGPLFGGILAGWGLWRWAFWIDIPIAFAVGALAERTTLNRGDGVPTSATASAKIGYGRLALLGFAVMAVALGGTTGRALTGGCGIIAGLVLLGMTLRRDDAVERRASGSRLLPTGAFDPRHTLGAVSLAMALMAGSTMANFYVPYVATAVGGHAPITGGYLSADVAVSWTLAAFASSSAGRTNARVFIIGGPMLQAAGFVLTAWALKTGSLVLVAASLVPVGAGVGLAWAYLASLLIASANDPERDLAGAFISTLQLIAQAFASALAGVVANLAGFADPALGAEGAMRAVVWVFLVFSALPVAAVPAALRAARSAAQS
ncbi:MAG TPA: MFS transporter [Stellaceae bacterium]|jgi:MFS family permease